MPPRRHLSLGVGFLRAGLKQGLGERVVTHIGSHDGLHWRTSFEGSFYRGSDVEVQIHSTSATQLCNTVSLA